MELLYSAVVSTKGEDFNQIRFCAHALLVYILVDETTLVLIYFSRGVVFPSYVFHRETCESTYVHGFETVSCTFWVHTSRIEFRLEKEG